MSMSAEVRQRPLLMSVHEAAHALGVGRTTIYDLIARGRLVTVQIGRRRLVTVESVEGVAHVGPGPYVRLLGRVDSSDRVAFVAPNDASEPVRVRMRIPRRDGDPKAWRCDACGDSPVPACDHAKAAAERITSQIDTEIHRRRTRRHAAPTKGRQSNV